ncbi:MAG TPA: hypothetical protein HPP77_08820 [Candidatus Hydrogenedentes bacterium]|nr:hypothetical protein [Candidatus Hydrogenedentota bacterium]
MVAGMARMARAIALGLPHRVTQRGKRPMETFLCEDDYTVYLDLTAQCRKRHSAGV